MHSLIAEDVRSPIYILHGLMHSIHKLMLTGSVGQYFQRVTRTRGEVNGHSCGHVGHTLFQALERIGVNSLIAIDESVIERKGQALELHAALCGQRVRSEEHTSE